MLAFLLAVPAAGLSRISTTAPSKTPITVLSGFLGAGKTTLLSLMAGVRCLAFLLEPSLYPCEEYWDPRKGGDWGFALLATTPYDAVDVVEYELRTSSANSAGKASDVSALTACTGLSLVESLAMLAERDRRSCLQAGSRGVQCLAELPRDALVGTTEAPDSRAVRSPPEETTPPLK